MQDGLVLASMAAWRLIGFFSRRPGLTHGHAAGWFRLFLAALGRNESSVDIASVADGINDDFLLTWNYVVEYPVVPDSQPIP